MLPRRSAPELTVVVTSDATLSEPTAARARPEGAEETGVATQVLVVDAGGSGEGAAWNDALDRVKAPIVVFASAGDELAPGIGPAVLEAMYRWVGVVQVDFPAEPGPPAAAWSTDALRKVLPMPAEPFRCGAEEYLRALVPLLGDVVTIDHPGLRRSPVTGEPGGFDLDRTQATVARAVATDHEVEAFAERRRGRVEPPSPRRATVAFQAARLISYRLRPDQHPVAGDRRRRAVLDGVRAARGRHDLDRHRRAALTGWFVAAGFGPRRLVPWLAERPAPRR